MKRASRWRGRCCSSSCSTSRRRPMRRSRSWRSTPTSSAGTSRSIRPWLFTWGELGLIQICGKNAVNLDAVIAACKAIAGHPGVLRFQDFVDQYGRDRALHAGDRGPSVRDLGPGRGRRSRRRALHRRRPAARHRQRAQPRHLLQDDPALRRRQSRSTHLAVGSAAWSAVRWWAAWFVSVWATIEALICAVCCCVAAPHCSTRPSDILAMVGWAFSLAMAGNFPALVLGIWWKRATTAGAICGHHRRLGHLPVLPRDHAVLPAGGRDLLRHVARC